MPSGIESWSTSSKKLKWMIEQKLYFKIVEGGDGSESAEKVTGVQRTTSITTK